MAIPVPTNDTLRREAKIYLKHKGSITAAAEEAGVARSTFRDHLKLAMQEGILDPSKVAGLKNAQAAEADEVQQAKRTLVAKRENSAKQALLKASQDEVKQLESRVEELEQERDLLLALENNKWTGKIPVYSASKGNAIPVLVLSDLHMEEKVDAGQVAGSDNEYTPEIAAARLQKVFQHGLFMTDVMRGMAKIDTFCLAILGDLISGEIHDELTESNHLSPIAATLLAEEELGKGIEYLLSKGGFNKIIVPCSFGNHDRNTDLSRCKDGAEHSYAWMCYQMLAKNFRGEKRLEWQIARGYHNYVRLWDTTLRFHHGDAITYGGGVGGVTIPIRKAIANWNTVCAADLDVMGHFHQMTDGGDFIVNGSLIGFNEYSLRIKARFERPRQTLFLVDQSRGKTLTTEVFVE